VQSRHPLCRKALPRLVPPITWPPNESKSEPESGPNLGSPGEPVTYGPESGGLEMVGAPIIQRRRGLFASGARGFGRLLAGRWGRELLTRLLSPSWDQPPKRRPDSLAYLLGRRLPC